MAFGLTLAGCGQQQNTAEVKDVQDIRNMSIRPDGRFDVTCRDGSFEVRTPDEVRSGQVCLIGGGPADGLRCIARDNDGSVTRYNSLVYGTIDACNDAVRCNRPLGQGTTLVCTSRDRDGRDPWTVAKLANGQATLQPELIYGTFDMCEQSLLRSRFNGGSLLLCGSRDRDGRDPWNFFSINSTDAARRLDDFQYSTFQQCIDSL
jgi:hypothetical protein